jgi:hypothetical protein
MSLSRLKALFWLSIAVAIAMMFAAALRVSDSNFSLGLFSGAAVLIAVTAIWYRSAKPRAQARDAARQVEQLAALKQQLELMGEPVKVKASSFVLVLVLLTCASIAMTQVAIVDATTESITLAIAAVVLTMLFAWAVVPFVGKPALTISREGLDTPAFGFLRWNEIDSIGLQRHTHKGMTSYSLDLLVPTLNEREDLMHPLIRAARRMFPFSRRKFAVIRLKSPSLPAQVIHELCLDLWMKRTGKPKRTWVAALTDGHIEESRRGEEQLAMLKRAGEVAERDPAEAMKILDEYKRSGAASTRSPGKRRLGRRAAELQQAFMAELQTIDPRDDEARKQALDRYVKAQLRTTRTTWVVTIVVIVALVVGVLKLV